MTITEFEKKLKQIDPRFEIRKYGNGIAGLHRMGPGGRPDGRYLLRLPQGEIFVYSVFEDVEMVEYGRPFLLRTMTRRGRQHCADLLHTWRFINYEQRNFLIRGE